MAVHHGRQGIGNDQAAVFREPAHLFALRPAHGKGMGQKYQDGKNDHPDFTLGWRPQCACPEHDPVPQTVLDPFAGSGTTGAVAVQHGRKAVLLDLSTKYIDLQFDRTSGIQITMQV
jgi:hypothetical protein